MDLKKKFKNLLQKEGIRKVQNALKPNLRNSEPLFSPLQLKPFSRDADSEIRCIPTDPEADDAILESIDPVFFTTSFDPSLFELKKLKNPLDSEDLTISRERLRKEFIVVSKRVYQLILGKQSCYTGEIERIREIEDDLVAAIFTCQEARRDLSLTKQEFTSKSLGVIANHQKRQADKLLLKSLKTIHTLQSADGRLQELLAEDNYLAAIQLLLEFQQTAENYKHFNCIFELSKKLMETMEAAEERLDTALSKICLHFDEKHYAKLHLAYQLLGKTQTCVDQLLMHYASAIHNTAFGVVHGFAELCRSPQDSSNFQKKPYPDLCTCLNQDFFIPCLGDLCKSMWQILMSYHRLLGWHSTRDLKLQYLQNHDEVDADLSTSPSESLQETEEAYVDQKLRHGASRIWQDVQSQVRTFLLACNFSGFKIDDLLRILSIIHTLRLVGKEFCGSESDNLRDCIREASLRYFLNYHHIGMEELRMFLENESWKILPLRSDFTIFQLQEFKFLANCENSHQASNLPTLPLKVDLLFLKYGDDGTPFDISKEISDEDIFSLTKERGSNGCKSPKSSSSDEVKGHYEWTQEIMENNEADDELETTGTPPFITNTSLSILRLFGRYLNLMYLLKPIASDVAICMSQLFEYYFYTVFLFFGAENGEVTIEKISNAQLRLALSRIKSQLIQKEGDEKLNPGSMKTPEAYVNPSLNLRSEDDLYGFPDRVAGSESSIYLALQFDSLKKFIESHVPESDWDRIAQLIDSANILSDGLRRLNLAGVTCRAINYQVTAVRMGHINWEVKELMCQHSPYVDLLLREIQLLAEKVDHIAKKFSPPPPLLLIFWEQIFKFCCRAFVDGFSSMKKCSNSGRGLMQLDFTQFVLKYEKITPLSIKTHPDKQFVDNYVKAYYMPETIMEDWIKSHSEYSSDQLISLIHCTSNGNRRSRQHLLNILEDSNNS